MKTSRPILAALLLFSMAACSNLDRQGQRTLSGAGIGAAGGAAISAIAGGSILTGALVGTAAGAAVGAFTNDNQVKVDPSAPSR